MKRLTLIFSIVLIAIALMTVNVKDVSAGWMQCRSDPIVILSNGIIMDLSADIGTFPWRVERVDYVLHVPEGVSLVASIATPTWLTTVETFTLIDDAQPGEYRSVTTAYTRNGNASVTAHSLLLSATGIQLDMVSAAGNEGQPIHITIHVP